MQKYRRVIGLLIIVLLYSGIIQPTFSQSNDSKKLFDQGVIYYQNKLYKDAFKSFESILSLAGNNPFKTSAYLMLGKTARELGDIPRAKSYLNYLTSTYPQSQYTAHGYYVLGQMDLQAGNYTESFKNFALSKEYAKDEKLEKLATIACDTIITHGINNKKLLNIYQSYPWQKNRLSFQFWVAESLLKQGENESAIRILDTILTNESLNGPDRQKALAMKSERYLPKVNIGVIVPVSGYFSQEAKDLVRGMALALNEQPQVAKQIDLKIVDSKGSQVGTVLTTLAMQKDEFTLLIGELEDNNSIALAGYASREDLPLIIPVATSNGLASIGGSIFQANNDLNVRGAALAEYAIKKMGMSTFATLAPADEYGHTITDAFTNKIDQLGGTIIAQKWYYPGTTDMKRQFDAIREAGLRHGFRDSLQAKGLEITQTRIDSIFHVMDEFAKEETDDEKGLIELTSIPVKSIDGFFMPVYSEELSIVAPQMALTNIEATPLGGGYWLDPVNLRRQRNYLNGCVFISGYYFSETDLQYKKFVNDFRKLTGASPEKLSVYGYNVMNLVLKAVKNGHTGQQDLVNYLNNAVTFDGIGGQISFKNSARVNNAVNILQYNDGNLEKIN